MEKIHNAFITLVGFNVSLDLSRSSIGQTNKHGHLTDCFPPSAPHRCHRSGGNHIRQEKKKKVTLCFLVSRSQQSDQLVRHKPLLSSLLFRCFFASHFRSSPQVQPPFVIDPPPRCKMDEGREHHWLFFCFLFRRCLEGEMKLNLCQTSTLFAVGWIY